MTRTDQKRFVRELTASIREEMLGHIKEGRVPEHWDGIELRWLLGEIFWNNYLGYARIKPRDRRHREFKRHIFTTGGF